MSDRTSQESSRRPLGTVSKAPASKKGPEWWNWRVFVCICLFRLLQTLLIQSQFDPDEFWQTLEPAYCMVFYRSEFDVPAADFANDKHVCPGWTWEWLRRPSDKAASIIQTSLHGPVRSFLSVLPTILFYKILQYTQLDTASSALVARGPVWLNALTVAAPCDYAVYVAAKWLFIESNDMGNPNSPSTISSPEKLTSSDTLAMWALFASLSSWFNAYTLVRTYANCQETLCLILSIALVSPELLADTSRPYFDCRSKLAFYIGGLCVAIRFTSVVAYIPMGILLAMRTLTWRSRLGFILLCCALYGLLGIATAILVDRCLYGFWTVPFLGNFYFNVVQNRAQLYGTHPWHFYFAVGLPVITGLLFPFVVLDAGNMLGLLRSYRIPYGARNLWIIAISYLFIMSNNAHKEFRFILPVLPLLYLLVAPHLQSFMTCQSTQSTNRTRRLRWKRLAIYSIANFVVVLYLGCMHQSAPISIQYKIREVSRTYLKSTNHSTPSCGSHDTHDPVHTTHYLSSSTSFTSANVSSPSSTTTSDPSVASCDASNAFNAANSRSTSYLHSYPTLSVYYWTGQCHSTPLLSHLHVPPIHLDTWSLDCSPECRARQQDAPCEVDRFIQDPAKFAQEVAIQVATRSDSQPKIRPSIDTCKSKTTDIHTSKRTYEGSGADRCTSICEDTVTVARVPTNRDTRADRSSPDFVVTTSTYAIALQPVLHSWGLQEIARYTQSVRGVRIGPLDIGSDVDCPTHHCLDITSWVQVSMEVMVLYSHIS
jgi:GPI mannosyltransferase 3